MTSGHDAIRARAQAYADEVSPHFVPPTPAELRVLLVRLAAAEEARQALVGAATAYLAHPDDERRAALARATARAALAVEPHQGASA